MRRLTFYRKLQIIWIAVTAGFTVAASVFIVMPMIQSQKLADVERFRSFQSDKIRFARVGRHLKVNFANHLKRNLDRPDPGMAERLLYAMRDTAWNVRDIHTLLICDSAFNIVNQYRSIVVMNDTLERYDMVGYYTQPASQPFCDALSIIGKDVLTKLPDSERTVMACYWDQSESDGSDGKTTEFLQIAMGRALNSEMFRDLNSWKPVDKSWPLLLKGRPSKNSDLDNWKHRDILMIDRLSSRNQWMVIVWRDGLQPPENWLDQLERSLRRENYGEGSSHESLASERELTLGLTFMQVMRPTDIVGSYVHGFVALSLIFLGLGLLVQHLVFSRLQGDVDYFFKMTGDVVEIEKAAVTPGRLMDYLQSVFKYYNALISHFVTPYQQRDIEEVLSRNLQTVGNLLDDLLEVRRKEAIQTEALRQKTGELDAARRLQLSMLPKANVETPRIQIFGMMRMATEVGGDYYDVIRLSDTRFAVAIGDATGHGMASGLVVAMVKMALLNAMAMPEILSGAQLLKHINRALKQTLSRQSMGMGLCLAFIDTKDRTLELASSGMPFPYVYHTRSRMIERPEMKGPPLGYLTAIEPGSVFLQLAQDDVVMLATDGLMERFDSSREQWGEEAMQEEIETICNEAKEAEVITRRLFTACDAFAGGMENHDDMTVVTIHYL